MKEEKDTLVQSLDLIRHSKNKWSMISLEIIHRAVQDGTLEVLGLSIISVERTWLLLEWLE